MSPFVLSFPEMGEPQIQVTPLSLIIEVIIYTDI